MIVALGTLLSIRENEKVVEHSCPPISVILTVCVPDVRSLLESPITPSDHTI